jgi:hypothetical protein
LGADHDCGFESASNRNTARAKRRESACRELDKIFRANVPKVSAVGTPPTSTLACVMRTHLKAPRIEERALDVCDAK